MELLLHNRVYVTLTSLRGPATSLQQRGFARRTLFPRDDAVELTSAVRPELAARLIALRLLTKRVINPVHCMAPLAKDLWAQFLRDRGIAYIPHSRDLRPPDLPRADDAVAYIPRTLCAPLNPRVFRCTARRAPWHRPARQPATSQASPVLRKPVLCSVPLFPCRHAEPARHAVTVRHPGIQAVARPYSFPSIAPERVALLPPRREACARPGLQGDYRRCSYRRSPSGPWAITRSARIPHMICICWMIACLPAADACAPRTVIAALFPPWPPTLALLMLLRS
jgi:hypothetical protein